MRTFAGELTLDAEALRVQPAWVLERAHGVAGFYTLLGCDPGEVELEHLFVEPVLLRRGYGARLFAHALQEARSRGWRRMRIQSDPNAEAFYVAQGARLVRHIASSIPGRSLPLMRVELSPPR